MRLKSIPAEAIRLMNQGATASEATLVVERSSLSSRSRVLREANRRGKWFGVISRTTNRPFLSSLGIHEARALAADSVEGRDPYQHCAVPERWRPLFVRTFVKAAIHAAHTDRTVTVSSKYGV